MSRGAKRFWALWDKVGVLLIFIAVAVVFGLIDAKIVAPVQLIEAVSRAAITGTAAAGMTFAICAGGFDLSVGSILSLICCVLAINIASGVPTIWAVSLGLCAASICGLVNGLIITKLKIQTFVATLATQLAFAGAALVYSNATAVQISNNMNADLRFLYTGKLGGVLPMPVVILLLVYGLAFCLYKFTPFGIKVRAIGSNETAARTTGIRVDRTLIWVFVLTAATAAMAAVLQVAKLTTGDPNTGVGWEINPITAVILGGTALTGGTGNLWGTLVGAILVEFVGMGLNILGVGEAGRKLAIAIVLIFALSINGIKLITQREGK